MLTGDAARMNLGDDGIAVGKPTDLLVLDCGSDFAARAEIACPLVGLRRGRKSFDVDLGLKLQR